MCGREMLGILGKARSMVMITGLSVEMFVCATSTVVADSFSHVLANATVLQE